MLWPIGGQPTALSTRAGNDNEQCKPGLYTRPLPLPFPFPLPLLLDFPPWPWSMWKLVKFYDFFWSKSHPYHDHHLLGGKNPEATLEHWMIPPKFNIDTQNGHIWKKIPFKNHIILGIYSSNFRYVNSLHLQPKLSSRATLRRILCHPDLGFGEQLREVPSYPQNLGLDPRCLTLSDGYHVNFGQLFVFFKYEHHKNNQHFFLGFGNVVWGWWRLPKCMAISIWTFFPSETFSNLDLKIYKVRLPPPKM